MFKVPYEGPRFSPPDYKAQIQKLENPDWATFITLCHRWLEKYPEDIFDGSSGDPGPVFVTRLRNALKELEDSSCP